MHLVAIYPQKSQFTSLHTPTPTVAASPPPPDLCRSPSPLPPPTIPSVPPPSWLPVLSWGRPAPTTIGSPVLQDVALLSDIYPVPDKLQYNVLQYSGDGGRTSPPPPNPLPLSPRPEVGKPTWLSCVTLSALPPEVFPTYGGTSQGYSQYWWTRPRSLRQIRGLSEPPPCISSWKSGVLLLPPENPWNPRPSLTCLPQVCNHRQPVVIRCC